MRMPRDPDDRWRPLTLGTRLGDLVGTSLVVADGLRFGDAVAVSVKAASGTDVAVTYAFLDGEALPRTTTAGSDETVADALMRVLDFSGRVAVAVAGVRWASRVPRAPTPLGLAVLLVPIIITSAVAWLGAGTGGAALVAGLLGGVWAVAWGLKQRQVTRTAIEDSSRAGVLSAEASHAALSRALNATRPQSITGRPDPSALPRVRELKSEYGKLLSDVVYRIENSSLFDNSVPLTREFQLLMMRWDDEHALLDDDERATLARRLELAFHAARRHAETVGLSHLPRTARADAARAAKAARLSQRAATPGEREAALSRASHLLGGLALYYLPSPREVPRMLERSGDPDGPIA
ncbi:hypothetical protein C3E87_06180 [Tessaracoccus sp. ZS01]|nr:hypothetical protein [Tessaracoccus sp. ZS01]OMG57181.1 hypothetical protein BJN44_06190 [Tessaracoccus sp. ZS01]